MISVACRGAGHVNVRRNRVTQSCHRTNVHVADQNGKKHALLAQSPSQHRQIPHLALTQLYGAIMLAYATSGALYVATFSADLTTTHTFGRPFAPTCMLLPITASSNQAVMQDVAMLLMLLSL